MAGERHEHRIGIMVVDGHEVVRQGVKALVAAEQDMDVVAETGRADEIVPLYADSRPARQVSRQPHRGAVE